jgi:hypothetical protein
MTRQTTDSFARRLLDQVGATEQLRASIEAVIGADRSGIAVLLSTPRSGS